MVTDSRISGMNESARNKLNKLQLTDAVVQSELIDEMLNQNVND